MIHVLWLSCGNFYVYKSGYDSKYEGKCAHYEGNMKQVIVENLRFISNKSIIRVFL